MKLLAITLLIILLIAFVPIAIWMPNVSHSTFGIFMVVSFIIIYGLILSLLAIYIGKDKRDQKEDKDIEFILRILGISNKNSGTLAGKARGLIFVIIITAVYSSILDRLNLPEKLHTLLFAIYFFTTMITIAIKNLFNSLTFKKIKIVSINYRIRNSQVCYLGTLENGNEIKYETTVRKLPLYRKGAVKAKPIDYATDTFFRGVALFIITLADGSVQLVKVKNGSSEYNDLLILSKK